MGAKSNGAVTTRQDAADRAREARIRLHRDRDARDARVEAAAVEVFGVADQLAAADDTLAAVKTAAAASIAAAESEHRKATRRGEATMSGALRKLTTEKLNVPEIAELTSLSAADVRRLTKPAVRARKDSASAAGPAADTAASPEPGQEPGAAFSPASEQPASSPASGESATVGDGAASAAAV